MSADRLREAARVLRERAEAATPGDWREVPMGSEGSTIFADLPGVAPSVRTSRRVGRCGEFADARFIATMHPGVALALAATMELEASLLDSMPPFAELMSVLIEHQSGIKGAIRLGTKPDGSPHMHAESTPGLLAIADLILGDQS